ncbi:MAG: hypothetical protein A4S09_10890 [Proteobacteria bacterium SG_bin7]|nr:MAG: hypothetical protein A4S09_10890 [Proteobacteria bacterium SG_bin7]
MKNIASANLAYLQVLNKCQWSWPYLDFPQTALTYNNTMPTKILFILSFRHGPAKFYQKSA